MSNWKRHERQTAEDCNGTFTVTFKNWNKYQLDSTGKVLGCKRISRGMDFSRSLPDIEHPLLSIECKYRARISGFLKDGVRQDPYEATRLSGPLR